MATDKLVDFDHVKDFISREAALDFHIQTYDLNISVQDQRILGDRFEEFLKSIPAADVRPVVRGAWKPNPRNPYWLDCTVCGYAKPEKTVYNFCPRCGADMRGGGGLSQAALRDDDG